MAEPAIQMIKQTNPYNCGSACLAMVLDLSIGTVERTALKRIIGELMDGGQPVGATSYEMCAILWNRQIPNEYLFMPNADLDDLWIHRVAEKLPAYRPLERLRKHLDTGGIAILAVDSLRNKGGTHWIVACGGELFDPQTGDGPLYRQLDDHSSDNPLRVSEAILMRNDDG